MSQTETTMEDGGHNANNAPQNPSKPPLPKEPEASLKPKRKSMKVRSKAWDHFTKYEDDEGITRAKCNYCGKDFKCHSRINGTTILNTHMKACKKNPHNIETHQAQLALQPASGQCENENANCLTNWKFDQNHGRKCLAYMIVIDELPFSFVDREGFKRFVASICPRFKIPSRWTLQRDIFQLYLDEKLKLRNVFDVQGQRICITTDTWTSIQRINYMCITAHYIDVDWQLNKKILNFCPISSHKGEDIGNAIETCLHDWGVRKVFTITVDNASSNDVAISYLKKKFIHWEDCIANCKYIHMRCIAHILNLVVVEGLKELCEPVKKVRNYVRYVRQSPSRLQKFNQCVEIEKIDCKKSLCLDVPTRWNSTYLMLNTAEKFERAFNRFGTSMDPFFEYEMIAQDGLLGSDDWTVVRSVSVMLKQFYDATLRISGSLYVTSNTLWTEIAHLHAEILEWINHNDEWFSSMGKRMKGKFDKYWGDHNKMNKLIYISVMFDPREKIEAMEFVFEDFFGKVEGAALFLNVKKEMFALFDEYKKRLQPVDESVNTSQSVSNSNEASIDRKPRPLLREKYKKTRSDGVSGAYRKTELEVYLAEAVVDDQEDFDVLKWWKMNSGRFPVLSEMARDVLAVPISTVASECAFSTGGRVLDSFRSSLTPKFVEALVCAQDWHRHSFKKINIEEDLDDLEKAEKDLPVDKFASLNIG